MNAKRLAGVSVIAAGLAISALTAGLGTTAAEPPAAVRGGRVTTVALATTQEARQVAGKRVARH